MTIANNIVSIVKYQLKQQLVVRYIWPMAWLPVALRSLVDAVRQQNMCGENFQGRAGDSAGLCETG